MDHRSIKEREDHHHQHHFSNQQQPEVASSAGRGSNPFITPTAPFSRYDVHPPRTRDWFNTQPSEENDDDDARRRQVEHRQQHQHQHQHQRSASSSYCSYTQSSAQHSQTLAAVLEQIEKEHMFDKVVTPSDVGKLNRLVIPKQHAERYFPLDSSANEKGLLLNFEDRTRKLWRFRYSYWNSSQSYVMTKGWSRFVKEKRLDAGDMVSFQRGVGEAFRDRLFIDWRRRPSNPLMFHHHQHQPSLIIPSLSLPLQYFPFHQSARSAPWETSTPTSLYLRPLAQLPSGHHFSQHIYSHSHHNNQYQQLQQGVSSYPYEAAVEGSSSQTVLYLRSSADESPRGAEAVHPKTDQGKKLRLFGVNMECDNHEPNYSLEETENLSSWPTPGSASLPPESPGFRNHDSTSDNPDKRSPGAMSSLSLSF